MKTLINLENEAGIGTGGRHLMRHYSQKRPTDKLYVVSPNGVDVPSNATNVHSYALPRDPINLEDHTLDSLKQAFAKNINSLKEIIQTYQPDIANCTGTYTYPWLLLNAAMQENLPIIVRVAGIINKESNSPIRHEMGCEFIQPDKFAYIFPSTLAQRTLEKIHGTKFKNSLVSPNGVGDVFFNSRETESRTSPYGTKLNIGTVGRLVPVKNFEYLGILSDSLSKTGIPANIYCVSGASNNRNNQYSAKLHDELVQKDIKFLEPMTPKQLANFYKNMDLTISPSHFETHGNTTLEVMATGTPALVSHNVGASEVIESLGLRNHIVNFEKDTEQVIETIRNIQNGTLNISDEIINKLKEKYSWEAVFEARENFRKATVK